MKQLDMLEAIKPEMQGMQKPQLTNEQGYHQATLLPGGCHILLRPRRGHRASWWGWAGGRAYWQHRTPRAKPCLILDPLMLLKLRNHFWRHIAQLMLTMCKIAPVTKVAIALFPPAREELNVSGEKGWLVWTGVLAAEIHT